MCENGAGGFMKDAMKLMMRGYKREIGSNRKHCQKNEWNGLCKT